MSQWNQFLTEIANSIIQAHTTQKSLSLYVPFEDSLSKSLAFDKISKELLEREIEGNGTEQYYIVISEKTILQTSINFHLQKNF